MKIQNRLYRTSLLIIIFLCIITSLTHAQNENCTAATIADFYECYGGEDAFNAHSKEAISTFIQTEDAIHAGDYAQAKTLLDMLFTTYPTGSNLWWNAYNGVNGSNIGSPNGYYGLRMMEDIVDHHLNNNEEVEARTVNMSIILVGCSEGIQPTTDEELMNGTGPFVTNSLDPALVADDYRTLRQSIDLFTRYVPAITKGELEVNLEIIELPDVCMDVSVNSGPPFLAYGSLNPAWDALSDEIKASTDWYMMLYPSHVPESPDFDDNAFITGGMGADSKGGPVFIADDKWIVRKPAHLGAGIYSDIERRMYLPQWYQHEFFHHLFRIYPELELEVNGHDWFDQNFWPDDFEGQFETDFYAEALHKRLQADCVPLATKLITRVQEQSAELFNKLSIDELIGEYSLDNIANDWHEGQILKQGDKYMWRNTANVQWEVFPNIETGKLETGADCPYPGQDFFLELYQTVDGSKIPGVVSLIFQGDIYKKRFNILRQTAPVEIALGNYTRVPYESMLHSGNIIKEAGELYWENEAGDRWSLTPNVVDESFALSSDSPTPDQEFQLILSEGECELHVLGFKYDDYYYWREKRDPLNGSPIIVDPMPDLETEKNFAPFTFDLSTVFSDPEDDLILHFATSSESGLITTTIENQQLLLTGTEEGTVSIFVTAIDGNGGHVTDDFTVQVVSPVSTQDVDDHILLHPNPTIGIFTIEGDFQNHIIQLISADGKLQKQLRGQNGSMQVDISDLDVGVYFLSVLGVDGLKEYFGRVVRVD